MPHFRNVDDPGREVELVALANRARVGPAPAPGDS